MKAIHFYLDDVSGENEFPAVEMGLWQSEISITIAVTLSRFWIDWSKRIVSV